MYIYQNGRPFSGLIYGIVVMAAIATAMHMQVSQLLGESADWGYCLAFSAYFGFFAGVAWIFRQARAVLLLFSVTALAYGYWRSDKGLYVCAAALSLIVLASFVFTTMRPMNMRSV